MRTVDAAITSAEVGNALAYRHAATVQNELLSFGAPTALTNASLDTLVPQSFRQRSSGNSAYASYRFLTGVHYMRAVDATASSDFQLSSTSATTLTSSVAMRAGFSIESGTHYLYDAYSSGGAIRVRRSSLSGTSNPVTVSFSDYGASTFGGAITTSGPIWRRVEAVCPTDTQGVIVCVGEHDTTNSRSTLTFWWIASSSATPLQLNTILQMPMNETPSFWYTFAKHCAHVAAIALTDGILIIAPSAPAGTSYGTYGRSVAWTLRTGVESEPAPCVPTDIEQTSVFWNGSSLTSINGTIYQCGQMVRLNSDSTLSQYDGYLQTADGKAWSVGERSHFISTTQQKGSILYPVNGNTLYYVGGLYHAAASVTPVQYPSVTGQSVTITSDIKAFSINQVTNAADTLDMTVDNADGTYDTNALVKRGAVVYLTTGQDTTLSAFGEYGIDGVTKGVTTAGRQQLKIKAREIAGKRIADYKLPVDLFLDSHGALSTTLTKDAGLIIKTNEGGYTFSSGDSLKHDGLMEPFIAYADAAHGDVSLQKASVYMGVSGDNYHVSSIGFLVGADESGGGHVVMMPKANSWTTYGKTQPEVRRLNLPAVNTTDPDALDSGFSLTPRRNAMWTNAGNGSLRTASVAGGSYRTRTSNTLAANTTYDVAVRVAGRRVALYSKAQNYASASAAANAGWTLQLEWLSDYADPVKKTVRQSGGLVLATDVMSSTALWEQAGGGDLTLQLTDADNTTSFSTSVATAQKDLSLPKRITNVTTLSGLSVGQFVKLIMPSYVDGIFEIAALNPGSPNTIDMVEDIGGITGTTITIYKTTAAARSGYASSGYSKRTADSSGTYNATTLPVDPGATKKSRIMRGRGYFTNDGGDAGAIRYFTSDGVVHDLINVSPTTTVGWDNTNPIALTKAGPPRTGGGKSTYSNGSDPAVWRLIASNNFLSASSLASTYNLPSGSSPAYLKVDDEIVRYAVESFTEYGGASNSWTMIPTYYASLAAASAGTTTLRNWRSSGGAQPGDNLGPSGSGGNLVNAAGLHVEVSSRNQRPADDADAKRYYVSSATYVGSPTTASTSYITLNQAYENVVNGIDPTALTGFGDVVIVSGRAQFGDTRKEGGKTDHDADAPVVYYPCNTSTGEQAYVKVTRYESFSGRYQSSEDAIRRICALAGQRDMTFRNAFSSSYTTGTYSFTIGTSATSLPVYENLSNFVLDMNCHVPMSSTNATGEAGITSINELRVDFRGYYRLVIGTYNTAGDINAGYQGRVRVGLETTSTDITADGSGRRWIEWAPVWMGDYNISGSYTGTTPNFTKSETAARNVDVRIAVQDNLIYVEINGQHLWTFNTETYTDGSTDYDVRDAGAVQVSYTSAVASNTCTARLHEIDDSVPAIALRSGSSAMSGVEDVMRDRRIVFRPTATGGLEVGQFWVRDDAGALRHNLLRHDWTQEDTRNSGHVQVTGSDARGETIDEVMMRAEGYRFDQSDNKLARTAAQCKMEARLWQRDMEEGYQREQLSGYARIAPQPEDKVSLEYAPSTEGIPTVAATDKVIESITLSADEVKMTAQYTLRGYVGTL